MSETLLSVGLDVGTTSTQLVVSSLEVENQASGFAVPQMAITRREILYQSPVYFTPLRSSDLVDGEALCQMVEEEYRRAGITREAVDTGAIIVTGETSRKENARTVLEALSHLAGEFVVATAGPDLESILAARGAGAPKLSKKTGKPVLHMDIGGGTTNLALVKEGEITATGCLNIGGRLIKTDEMGKTAYISPVLHRIFPGKIGETLNHAHLAAVVQIMAQVLEMAAGLREVTEDFDHFLTREAAAAWQPPKEPVLLSFSGGVAACVKDDHPEGAFGDLGPALGRAIRESRLCRGEYTCGSDPIRATVIGAGCHSTQLSGSTVFCRNVDLPLKNLPVVPLAQWKQMKPEGRVMVSLPGLSAPSYQRIGALADAIAAEAGKEVLLCIQQDMAKALGQALALRLPPETPILCLDGLSMGPGSYLDIGQGISCAYPVVIKTLVLGREYQS